MPTPALAHADSVGGSTFFTPSTMSVAFPNGHSATAGNALILVHGYMQNEAINIPSGWQLLNNPNTLWGDKRISVLGRIALGGETGYTITSTNSLNQSGGMCLMEWANLSPTFISSRLSDDAANTNTTSLSLSGLAIDPTYTGETLFVGGAITTNARTFTHGADFTTRRNASRLLVATKVANDAGNTPFVPAWSPSGTHTAGFLIALQGNPDPAPSDEVRVGFKRDGVIVYGEVRFKRTAGLLYPGPEVYPSDTLYPS